MFEKTVRVKGVPQAVWPSLINTVQAHRYEIQQTEPGVRLAAKRGSKLTTLFCESTRGGYRELNVVISPAGTDAGSCDVSFRFVFPSWAMTWGGTKKDCEDLVEEFARTAAGGAAPAAASPPAAAAPAAGAACPKCGGKTQPGQKFCGACGAKL